MHSFLFFLVMPKDRKYVQRKKLGSTRIDLSMKKKMQYIRKIITFGESYKKVSQDFRKEFGKELPRTTFWNWKRTGKQVLEASSSGSTHRISYKQSEEKVQFEEEVLKRIQSHNSVADHSFFCQKIIKIMKIFEFSDKIDQFSDVFVFRDFGKITQFVDVQIVDVDCISKV